jgi:hypothetical protein
MSYINTNKHSKLHSYIRWLEKNEYTIINYSNNQFVPQEKNTALFITNQASIIEAIREKYFEQLRYVSRGYIDNLSINPLLISLEIKKKQLIDPSIYLYMLTISLPQIKISLYKKKEK